jgi:hypothetical protein
MGSPLAHNITLHRGRRGGLEEALGRRVRHRGQGCRGMRASGGSCKCARVHRGLPAAVAGLDRARSMPETPGPICRHVPCHTATREIAEEEGGGDDGEVVPAVQVSLHRQPQVQASSGLLLLLLLLLLHPCTSRLAILQPAPSRTLLKPGQARRARALGSLLRFEGGSAVRVQVPGGQGGAPQAQQRPSQVGQGWSSWRTG